MKKTEIMGSNASKANQIRVETSLGNIVVEDKGDVLDYPGVYISLDEKDTHDLIPLANVEYDPNANVIQTAVYGKDYIEEPTHVIKHEINVGENTIQSLSLKRSLDEDTRKTDITINGKLYSLHIANGEVIITDHNDYSKIFSVQSVEFYYESDE